MRESRGATPWRIAPIFLALAVTLCGFVWLNRINPAFRVTDDAVRDQLLARDCTDLGDCHLIGATASVPGFHQGAVWLDLLIGVRLLGGSTSTERMLVLSLLALSAGTVFVVVWHWLRPAMALPAAALYTAALSLDPYPSLLINPSAAAFPDVLAAGGLLCYGLCGRRRFLVAAAFAVGVGINTHIGSLSLVPPLLAIAALGGRRPWLDVVVSAAVLAATCLFTSRAALLANIQGLARFGHMMPALAAGLAFVLLASLFGRGFRRLSPLPSAAVIGVVLSLPFALAAAWLVLWQRHQFGITYLHPVLAPASVLAAAVVLFPFELGAAWYAPLRWIPSAAVLVGAAFVGVSAASPGASPPLATWTVADAKAIAGEAAKRGWSYEDLTFHLQSADCRELLVVMSIEAPPPEARDTDHGRRQLQVVAVRRRDASAFAGAGNVVSLDGGKVAVVREIESWLQPQSLRACRRPLASGGSPVCIDAKPRRRDLGVPGQFLFAARSFPEIQELDLPPPYVASYQIPLAPGAGESRRFLIADHAPPGCPGWRITRADGVGAESPLPADQVRLHAASGGAGVLVIERPFDAGRCEAVDRRYPPCVLEMSPDDPLWRIAEAG